MARHEGTAHQGMTAREACEVRRIARSHNERMAQRYAEAVARKLDDRSVSFARWDIDLKTGASVPVFIVSPANRDRAVALGLSVCVEG